MKELQNLVSYPQKGSLIRESQIHWNIPILSFQDSNFKSVMNFQVPLTFVSPKWAASPPWSWLVSSNHDFTWGSCLAEGLCPFKAPLGQPSFQISNCSWIEKHAKAAYHVENRKQAFTQLFTTGGSVSPNLGCMWGNRIKGCVKPGKNCIVQNYQQECWL